jgi:hypothetical protein
MIKLVCIMAIWPASFAQTPTTDAASPPAAPITGTSSGDNANNESGLMGVEPAPASAAVAPSAPDKRLFGIIPNHRTDQFQPQYEPLTTRQKFAIARSDSFDWPNYLLLIGYAAQAQVASKGFKHNGSIKGFGEFYARSVSDQIIGSYVTEAILPSILHEDPRFFRYGRGSFLRRASHAAGSVFVVRRDDGGSRIAISELAGNAAVNALTTLYYPESRSAHEALERYAMQIGNDMIANFLAEFMPDIKRHIPFLRHRPAPPAV